MVSRIMNRLRTLAYAVALLGLSGAPLWAQASQCAEAARGGQTGDSYRLIGQSQVTVQLDAKLGGTCVGSVGGSVTETYNVGYYQNQETLRVARVNCSTGEVLGWL
jgi:hypothetical protein